MLILGVYVGIELIVGHPVGVRESHNLVLDVPSEEKKDISIYINNYWDVHLKSMQFTYLMCVYCTSNNFFFKAWIPAGDYPCSSFCKFVWTSKLHQEES